jgi:hypothetical protein
MSCIWDIDRDARNTLVIALVVVLVLGAFLRTVGREVCSIAKGGIEVNT